MPVLMAQRAGERMQTRTTYRTVSRMQLRLGWMEAQGRRHMALKQGLDPDVQPTPVPGRAAPAPRDWATELRQLAKLRDDGVLTSEEFDAKKKQLLGI